MIAKASVAWGWVPGTFPPVKNGCAQSPREKRPSAAVFRQALENIDDRIIDPRTGHEIAVTNVSARNDGNAPFSQPRIDLWADVDIVSRENVFELGILVPRRTQIDTDEEGRRIGFDPMCKLVEVAVERIEQHDAA